MRAACFVLSACAFAPAGCAALIANSGRDVSKLTNRAEVQRVFGTPAESGGDESQAFEEYKTRRKIAQPLKAGTMVVGYAMTAGFGEVLFFPAECSLAARRVVKGQKLRFTYDAQGNATSIKLDGDEIPSVGHVPRP